MTKPETNIPNKPVRNMFNELVDGFDALADEQSKKRTLKTHKVTFADPPELSPRELVKLREDLNLSRAVFAAYLRTKVRTLENWEQGRAKPNAQAVLLISLVKKYPDAVQRLASI